MGQYSYENTKFLTSLDGQTHAEDGGHEKVDSSVEFGNQVDLIPHHQVLGDQKADVPGALLVPLL